jgi:hypothetical protein
MILHRRTHAVPVAALLLAGALLASCAPTGPRNGAWEPMDARTGTVESGQGTK